MAVLAMKRKFRRIQLQQRIHIIVCTDTLEELTIILCGEHQKTNSAISGVWALCIKFISPGGLL